MSPLPALTTVIWQSRRNVPAGPGMLATNGMVRRAGDGKTYGELAEIAPRSAVGVTVEPFPGLGVVAQT